MRDKRTIREALMRLDELGYLDVQGSTRGRTYGLWTPSPYRLCPCAQAIVRKAPQTPLVTSLTNGGHR